MGVVVLEGNDRAGTMQTTSQILLAGISHMSAMMRNERSRKRIPTCSLGLPYLFLDFWFL